MPQNPPVCTPGECYTDPARVGGGGGGRILAEGTPEEIARSKASHTGQYLAPLLTASPSKVS